MNHDESSSSSGLPEDAEVELRLARALGEFTDLVGSGEEVDTREFLARYPDLAPSADQATLGAELDAPPSQFSSPRSVTPRPATGS